MCFFAVQTWTILYVMLILMRRPYMRMDDDMLLLLAEIEVFLLILCAWTLTRLENNKKLPYTTDVAMSAVLIALNIAMLILTLLLIGWNLRNLIRDWQRKKETKQEESSSAEFDAEKRKQVLDFVNPLLQNKEVGATDGTTVTFNPLSSPSSAASAPPADGSTGGEVEMHTMSSMSAMPAGVAVDTGATGAGASPPGSPVATSGPGFVAPAAAGDADKSARMAKFAALLED
jgi:hypothetical protein